jgi:hypothetical protein
MFRKSAVFSVHLSLPLGLFQNGRDIFKSGNEGVNSGFLGRSCLFAKQLEGASRVLLGFYLLGSVVTWWLMIPQRF